MKNYEAFVRSCNGLSGRIVVNASSMLMAVNLVYLECERIFVSNPDILAIRILDKE